MKKINPIDPNFIFVFGSNLAGRHGKGAAKYAKDYFGAIYHNPIGLQGRSYAIPTKDKNLKSLSLFEIKKYVDEFISFAYENKNLTFYITPIGCGLAGYSSEEIKPFFINAPDNCILPDEFL